MTAKPPPQDVTLQLARSTGGTRNTQLQAWAPTFEELCSVFDQPPEVGTKDGSYYVRGALIEGQSNRADSNITSASIVVLDCDSSFDPETGEILDDAPAPQQLHDVFSDLDINHCLYTTHSHQHGDKGNRYRIIIPAVTHNKGDLTGILEWIFHLLEEKGVYLVNVKENRSWSQPWYFPRLASEDSEFVCLTYTAGQVLDTAVALEWYGGSNRSSEPKAQQQAIKTHQPRISDSLFASFNNERGSKEWMVATLVKHGYQLKSIPVDDTSPTYRFLSPHSATGNPGIVMFCSDDGEWLVYSHHNEQEPLSRAGDAVKVSDAFDVHRILEHQGNEAAAITAWKRDQDGRPVIQRVAGASPANLANAIKAIAALDPPEIYQRAHSLCRVAHFEEAAETLGVSIPKGTAHIISLQRSVLTIILSRIIRWEIHKKGTWVESDPCKRVIAALPDSFGSWKGIPVLLGISETPILRSDGELMTEAGYDQETQLYVEGMTHTIKLDDTLTLDDARAAATALLAPFSEFPFVEEKLDQAVLLAYLFTLALRPQLKTAPLFCVSATAPGTGKGLLVECANLLVRGRDAATMPPVQGGSGEEEMRKRITALLNQGIASINMDNWTKPIGGESMNTLLTTSEWSDRLLGSSSNITLPVRCTLAATGNNLSVRGDMTRRSLVIQLDAKEERPELREFGEKNLPGRILQDRPDLLQHLFTILLAYQQAGSPGADDALLGRFEEWSRRVSGPIRWLGYPDPVATQERLRELDPETDKLVDMMLCWWNVLGTNWYSVADIYAAIGQVDTPNSKDKEALSHALSDAAGDGRGQINRRMLGRYLSRNAGRIVDDFKLERKGRTGSKSKHSQQYRVINISLLDDKEE